MPTEIPVVVTFEGAEKKFSEIKKKFEDRKPDLNAFSVENRGPYSRAEVNADAQKTKERSQEIFIGGGGRDEELYAEYCVMELIDSGELFDQDEQAVSPGSRYDDLFNGADLVITLYDENSAPALHFSIDVKAGLTRESENVVKALLTIKDLLNKGQLSKVKYHQFPNKRKEGQVFKQGMFLPNIVVWVEPNNVKRYMMAMSKKERERTPADNKLLAAFKRSVYSQMESLIIKFISLLREKETSADQGSKKYFRQTLGAYEKLLNKIQSYQEEYRSRAI
ncbi:MAG: hypothetical protein AAB575_04605 [Patescibacteria group bacterium]